MIVPEYVRMCLNMAEYGKYEPKRGKKKLVEVGLKRTRH